MGKSSCPTIDSLPKDVLLRIFSHFDIYSIHHSIAKVCTKWKELSLAPVVNRSISLKKDYQINFLKNLPTARHILRLSLFTTHHEKEHWLENLGSLCPNIKHLTIGHQKLCDSSDFKTISFYFPKLEHLDIHMSGRCIDEYLYTVRNVRSIVLHGSIPKGLLFSMANFCQNITELRLEDNIWQYHNDEVNYFLRLKYDYLTKLTLLYADDTVFELIASCEKLTDLRLFNCFDVQSESLLKLVALRKLTILHLYGLIQIAEEDLNCFIEESDMSKLMELRLLDSSFSDLTAEILCEKKLMLKSLELINCSNLTIKGALQLSLELNLLALILSMELPKHIVEIISNNSTLRFLTSIFTGFTNDVMYDSKLTLCPYSPYFPTYYVEC